jgi:lysozyme
MVSDHITDLLTDINKTPALEEHPPAPAVQQPASHNEVNENHPPHEKKTAAPDHKGTSATESIQAPKKSWHQFHGPLLLLNLVVTAVLLGLHFYLFKQNQVHRNALAQLSFNHRSLKDSLQNQTNRVSSLLLQINSAAAPSQEGIPVEAVKKYYGVDISHYNGDMVSRLTSHDSITFVLCKATEGVTYVDPYLAVNWNMVSQKKLLLGVYHFYKTADDPIHQARFFLSQIEKHGEPDLPLVIDIESGSLPESGSNHKSKAQIQDELHQCLLHLEAQTGRKPMIYTGRSFANNYLNNEKLSQYPLWLADYNKRPKTPSAWANSGYKIWQKTSKYPIEHSHVDFDIFHGKLSDLLK